MDNEHHDNRYEDGEPLFPLVAAFAYREWFDTPQPAREEPTCSPSHNA
jgi:hypothetical protein